MSAFRLIAAEKANHPVSVLGVSRSGFYAWERRAPSDRQLADLWLLEQIKEIRVITPDGQLIRELTLDPSRDYQPLQHT